MIDDLRTVADAGFSVPAHDLEHALHEMSHAVLLGFSPPYKRGLGMRISMRIGRMPSQLAMDWHEVKTCATELRSAMLLGLDAREHYLSSSGVLNGNTLRMDPDEAEARIDALVWTEATYRRALAVVDAIRVTAKALR